MTINQIDLSRLPPPKLIEELDYEIIYQRKLSRFKQLNPDFTAELESDPLIASLELAAYDELLLRQRVNDAAANLLVAKADLSGLQQLGAGVDVAYVEGEALDNYRERVQKGLNLQSAIASPESYRQLARAYDPINILDADCVYDDRGRVTVSLLAYEQIAKADASEERMKLGADLFPDIIPASGLVLVPITDNSSLINKVREHLSQQHIKPSTDILTVRAASLIPFKIIMNLTVMPGPDETVLLSEIQQNLNQWQLKVRKSGRNIARSDIIAHAQLAGIESINLIEPENNLIITSGQVAICEGYQIQVTGRDY